MVFALFLLLFLIVIIVISVLLFVLLFNVGQLADATADWPTAAAPSRLDQASTIVLPLTPKGRADWLVSWKTNSECNDGLT